MVMAKLHVICGNCGCADLWELTIERDGDDISSDHEAYEDSASLYCGNCSTLHNLKDSAKKVTFGSGATSPVPAQQSEALEVLSLAIDTLKTIADNCEWSHSDFPVIARAEKLLQVTPCTE